MKKNSKEYDKLHVLSKNSRILQGISALLDWDQETYMPHGAAAIRGEQLKTLAGIIHREKTSKKYANALAKLIDLETGTVIASDLTPQQVAAVKEWHRDFKQDTALPTSFVEEFAQLCSQSVLAWRSAKKENSFQQFAPFLDRIISMNRKKAEFLGYVDHPYDALIDHYEPDLKTQEVAFLFGKLKEFLNPLIKQLTTSQQIEDSFLHGNWNRDKQIEFSYKILSAMDYSLENGRLDFSSHPFSSASHPSDSRITTRIHPTLLTSNISVILHEAGHALYEMGLPQEQYGTPLGDARSLGVHESQSRWWETYIGLSKPFWQYFLPILKETFKGQLDSITLDQFYKAVNKVEPTLIRVDADEVTYPIHVILRFEMEKDLIAGKIKVRDIPEAWNAKMTEYLGITPKTYAEGCLQDIHWSMGAFGYFPTYTMGNLYAAHLFETFVQDHPDWETKVAQGELTFIKSWLQDKIYRHGRRYTTAELLKQATGHAFSADAYIRYLGSKYKRLYN